LEVEKVLVTSSGKTASFLGLWAFQDVASVDPDSLVPGRDRILGKLELPQGVTEFTGGTALFEREQWLLRPGDLVGVDLNPVPMPAGFYVPIDAIAESSGKNFVFVVDGEGKVRKVEVSTARGLNTTKRIQPVGEESLSEGDRIVLGGVHYLTDGESVNVASEVEAR